MDANLQQEVTTKQHKHIPLFPMLLVIFLIFQLAISLLILREVRILSSLQLTARNTTNITAGLPVGSKAPSFTLNNTDGREVSLSDFYGRWVLLMFSSPSCRYCVNLYPEVKRYVDTLKPDDVTFVMLSTGTVSENKNIKIQEAFSFEILAVQNTQFIEYRIPGTPYFVLVSPDGIIKATQYAGSAEDIAAFVLSAKK